MRCTTYGVVLYRIRRESAQFRICTLDARDGIANGINSGLVAAFGEIRDALDEGHYRLCSQVRGA